MLYSLFTNITSYLISFLVLGMIWYTHNIFFAYYTNAGSARVTFIHLILMFLITLFPVATRTINEYQKNMYVRIIYLSIFVLMQITNLLLFYVVKNEDEKRGKDKKELIKIITNTYADDSEELEKVKKYMAINTKEMNDYDIFLNDIPQEYRKIIEDYNYEQKTNFKYSIYSQIIITIFIFLAAIMLIYNTGLCYLMLLIGIILIIMGNMQKNRVKKN